MTDALLAAFDPRRGVSTDTRTLLPGQLFFALSGPNFDGNAYAATALAKGASAVVVDRTGLALDGLAIEVEDTLLALQALARAYRRTWNCPVIALTGSNGKTTTKELLAACLAQTHSVSATRGNLNNHIGVPLTLLGVPARTDVVVVEMGANHQGEIAELCRIAEPTHGFITNVGRAHLEGFGGPEGVRAGKGELFDYLAASHGYAFANVDDAVVHEMAQRVARRLPFATESAGEHGDEYVLRATLQREFPTVKATVKSRGEARDLASHLPGRYNYLNIAAACAVAHHFDVPIAACADAVAGYVPAASRSEVRALGDSAVLFDAYNANPDSVLAALGWIASRPEPHRVIVLGELAELGEYEERAHREVLEWAGAISGAEVYGFGPAYAGLIAAGAHFTDVERLGRRLRERLRGSESVVLIKGSRSNRLERLLDADGAPG